MQNKNLDLEGTWQGLTALQLAQANGHKKVVEILKAREGWGLRSCDLVVLHRKRASSERRILTCIP